MLPSSHAGKLTVGFLVLFTVAMNPPVITMVDSPVTVFGINLLYLWTAVWGILVSIVFVWAAWRNAFTLTEDQVPPELRDTDDVAITHPDSGEDVTTGGGS